MKKLILSSLSFLLLTFTGILFSCSQNNQPTELIENYELALVAESQTLWTGVAVSQEGRIFVNYPRWGNEIQFSVAEITSGEPVAFPNEDWNKWDSSVDQAQHFACVQSVYVDKNNNLWILDTGNPFFNGCIKNAPKLVKINLADNRVIKTIPFPDDLVFGSSYLNDMRIDVERNYAYLTDSGKGAIFIVNLNTGDVKRRFNNHSSTKAEKIILTIEQREWGTPVHSDGLALDPNNEYLYYQALTGRTLYRIKTEYLRDFSLTTAEVDNKVEHVGTSGASDAIEFGPDGYLYLTSIELNAIRRFDVVSKTTEPFVADENLKWPDSFSITNDGTIYVTTSHLHLGLQSEMTYKLFKVIRN